MISFNTRTITQRLGFLHPTSIYMDTSKNPLPCEIISIEFNSEYTIPQDAVEGNEFVSDNIARKPNTLQVEVYVHNDDIEPFYTDINTSQYGVEGFTVVDRNGLEYPNLRLMTISNRQSSDTGGCEFFTLEFLEMNSVSALQIQGYSLESPPGVTPIVNEGTKTALDVASSSQMGFWEGLMNKLGCFIDRGGKAQSYLKCLTSGGK